ncbi:MAG: NAD(P)/FAD-dependent oxidoreductase [Burkholderiaceae bacterium]
MDADFTVIGGGIVGLSIAYGLLRRGQKVRVLDEGDLAFRASRGNFGLVWVQAKGLDKPEYAVWTRRSAELYASFVQELSSVSNRDPMLVQQGGYRLYLSEQALATAQEKYTKLRASLGGDYPFEAWSHGQLKSEEPNIGPDVAGALFCPEDGHINPLRLLQSLVAAVRSLGGEILGNSIVERVTQTASGLRIHTRSKQTYDSAKLVLSAGLGAMKLGPELGFRAPVRPQQGQILITERVPRLMNRPSADVRQVNEGGVQIGASKREAGLEEKEDLQTVASLAHQAVRLFPCLARARLVRSWAALRIMTPDGYPIYEASPTVPGAYFVTCHSGITLAAAHALCLPDWLLGTDQSPDLSGFSEARFDPIEARTNV